VYATNPRMTYPIDDTEEYATIRLRSSWASANRAP
jgi:hypothetical protein